jgi:hypothetical protein
MQKHRVVHWLGRFVAALLLVLFARATPTQAAVESVAPISGGTVWHTSWKAGSFPSAVAACSSLSPGDCPVCGSLTYVGTKPNPAVPGAMDCVVFYNPGNGTPGWNTLSGTAIPYSNAVCPAPTVNPTVPYQYKASSGMCEREAQCIAPNAVNPATGKCEPPEILTITLDGGTTTEPGTSLPFIATVTNQDNQPPRNLVTVKISLKIDSTSGGHEHGDSTRPRGGIAEKKSCDAYGDGTCWTNQTSNGAVVFNFNAPEASGTHTITATCDGCNNTATRPADVKVAGLEPMAGSISYTKIMPNADTNHPNTNYLATEAMARLGDIGLRYSVTGLIDFGIVLSPLQINDASLKWGGILDCFLTCANSKPWEPSHEEHRKGTVVDIRANGGSGSIQTSAKMTESFIALTKNAVLSKYPESTATIAAVHGKGNGRHFHVRLLGRKE